MSSEETCDLKVCIYCERSKPKDQFPKHVHYKDNLDSRCKECVQEHAKIRSELHKNAPPKPEFCQCCGRVPNKWVLDHNHLTNEFRGWLCDGCNTGIGKLGDDLDGIVKALNYLLERR